VSEPTAIPVATCAVKVIKMVGDGGLGHKSISAEIARDPASRRRTPAFESLPPKQSWWAMEETSPTIIFPMNIG